MTYQRMGKTKNYKEKNNNNKEAKQLPLSSVGKNVESLELTSNADQNPKWYNHFQKKFKAHTCNFFLVIYPRVVNSYVYKNT